MIIGYARLSGLSDLSIIDAARQALIEAGAEKVYLDTDTPTAEIPQATRALESAIDTCQPGDVLLTLTPQLTTGSIEDLIAIAARLTASGCSLRVQRVTGNQTLDTGTQLGAMLLSALGLLAAFNPPKVESQHAAATPAQIALESFAPRRTRGRPPTASIQANEITRMREAGMRAIDIADRLKICRASVYRVLHMAGAETQKSPIQASQVKMSETRV